MKLYIPTCTLNFNNITTTESISPSSYYVKRGFGNRRFFSVEANSIDTAILLYSKFPHFHVEDGDLENYPMVIEIDTNDYPSCLFQKHNSFGNVDIYLCYESIYFNVFHTFFYFNDDRELQNVITKSEQSLEAKYAKRYRPNLLVRQTKEKTIFSKIGDFFSQQESDDFEWDKKMIPRDIQKGENHIKKDILIDRLKGFIFCYVIGANTSVSPEIGKLKALSRNIKNTLSAIVNSPTHRPSDTQNQAMKNDINAFHSIYEKIDEEQTYDIHSIWDCVFNYSPNGFNRAIANMQNSIRRYEFSFTKNRTKIRIKDIVSLNHDKIMINDKTYKTNFYEKLIQSLISGEYISLGKEMDITDEPLLLAIHGGKILKDLITNWNGSDVARYINSFLDNLQENVAFDIFSFKNDILNSFVAFCQKGDSIDRLSDYLIQCGFSNYKFAFGMYGAARGFASLPKTFTRSLIDGDNEYFKQFTCDLYQILFNTNFHSVEYMNKTESLSEILTETRISKVVVEDISSIEEKKNIQSPSISAIKTSSDLKNNVQSPKVFMYILDNIPSFTRTKAYKKLQNAKFQEDLCSYTPEEFKDKIYGIIGTKDQKAIKEKIDYAIKLEAERQNPQAFLCILDNFIKKDSKPYKRIAGLIQDKRQLSTKEISVQSKINNENETKVNTQYALFIEDPNCIQVLQECVQQPYLSKVIERLKWFQGEYAKGANSKYYRDARRDNLSTIKSFKRHLSKQDYASELNFEEIFTYLRKRYGK